MSEALEVFPYEAYYYPQSTADKKSREKVIVTGRVSDPPLSRVIIVQESGKVKKVFNTQIERIT